MKKTVWMFCAVSLLLCLSAEAQVKRGGYVFVDECIAPSTPPRGQGRTGTCWNFSGVALIESELLRTGKGEYDLSEMWIVRHAFIEKANHFVRRSRPRSPNSGGQFDCLYVFGKHGIVPEEVYKGLNYGTSIHRHSEFSSVVNGFVQGAGKTRPLSNVWKDALNGILDAYLGEKPEKFTYKGKEYTPQSFSEELGININDFVCFTSCTHHPYYSLFEGENSGNWLSTLYYNLPLDELMDMMTNAIENGYSIHWNADITNPGYCKELGICVYPVTSMDEIPANKRAEWAGWTDEQLQELGDRENKGKCFTRPVVEKQVTDESRQQALDGMTTAENHAMHIMGLCRDQNGVRYYKIKNSAHGQGGIYEKGDYYYCSYPYMRQYTIGIMLHKDGVSAEIAAKIGLNNKNNPAK